MRLAAITLTCATLITLTAAGVAQTAIQNPVPTVAERYLLAAANADRAAHQLAPVHLDPGLVLAARLHAYEMVRHASISHQFSGEPGLAARAGDAGAHFSLVTENVAEAPNAAQIHDLWMQSAGHRANLLDPAVDSVGIAVIEQRGQFYAVEDFSRHVAALTLSAQEAAVAQLLGRPDLVVSTGSEMARQTCAMQTGHAGARTPLFVMRWTAADLTRLPPELEKRAASGRYTQAEIGACVTGSQTPFSSYSAAVLLYP